MAQPSFCSSGQITSAHLGYGIKPEETGMPVVFYLVLMTSCSYMLARRYIPANNEHLSRDPLYLLLIGNIR